MSRNRLWSIVVLVCVAMLALAACGGTAPAPSGQAPSTSNENAAPTGAAGEAAAAPTSAASDTGSAAAANGTLNGVTLPDDAAPADQQVYVVHYDNTADFTTVDFYEFSLQAWRRNHRRSVRPAGAA